MFKPFVRVDRQRKKVKFPGLENWFKDFPTTSNHTSGTGKAAGEHMELGVEIPRSLNTGCAPSFHWLVWVSEDLSRSTGFKLATLTAVMSFKVGELYKRKKKKKKDNPVTLFGHAAHWDTCMKTGRHGKLPLDPNLKPAAPNPSDCRRWQALH